MLQQELGRQRDYLEMIASENFVPRAVLESQGSVLTNKYAEGYPGRRYYGGCEFVDIAEQLAIDRAKSLFGAEYANVQPHSGATANAAVLGAIAKPGDTILGMELAHGGHLTHGMKLNFSGKLYNATAYGVDQKTFLVDMDLVRDKALNTGRRLIAGWSAYPRQLDFAAFRAIADEVGARLWVDMAHFAGLVATGLHPSPVPYADVVSCTVHKTLAGPRSGFILSRDPDLGKKFNSAVFPGQQGGPLMHVIAAKATAFLLAHRRIQGPPGAHGSRRENPRRPAHGRGLEGRRRRRAHRWHRCAPRARRPAQLADGRQAGRRPAARREDHRNRNAVPFDPRPPMVTSGLRIGTPALATRGFGDEEFTEVADVIATALKPGADVAALARPRRPHCPKRSRSYPGLRASSVTHAVRAAWTAMRAGRRRHRGREGGIGRARRAAARARHHTRASAPCSSATIPARAPTSPASTATAPRWASGRCASTCRPRPARTRCARPSRS